MAKLRYSDRHQEMVWMICYRYKGDERCIDFGQTRFDVEHIASGLDSEDLLEVYVCRVEKQLDEALDPSNPLRPSARKDTVADIKRRQHEMTVGGTCNCDDCRSGAV